MTVEYYAARVESDIPVRGGTATATGSRVLLYLNSGVDSTSSIIPPGSSWTLTRVDADAATHAALQADNQIIWLSVDTLDRTWGTLPANVRNKIGNGLQSLGVSTAFITDATTLRQIIDELYRALEGAFA